MRAPRRTSDSRRNRPDAAPPSLFFQERFDECREKLTPFLKGCGYNTKRDVVFIPLSAYTSDNVVTRLNKETAPWWDGPSFIETLDGLPTLERNRTAGLRLPILSKYKDLGTVVEGKVEQGTISVGDKLCVMPNRTPVEVLNVWLDQDEVRKEAEAEAEAEAQPRARARTYTPT